MQSFNYRNILCKTKSWPWCAIAQCHVNELGHGITKLNYPAGISNLTEVKNILEIEHLSCYKFNSMTEVCWVFHHGKFTKNKSYLVVVPRSLYRLQDQGVL